MLARELPLILDGLEVGETPLLVPSVSSRVILDVKKTLQTISEFANGPLLISAYDYYWETSKLNSTKKFNSSFPELIFLDSGGYECNKDQDIQDIGLYKPSPNRWTKRQHSTVINNWSSEVPTVIISYDHPSKRYSIKDQIRYAKRLFKGKKGYLKEMLVKPEKRDKIKIGKRELIDVDSIIKNVKKFNSFDILGFTEKELGWSLFDRMTSIAKIRKAMDDNDVIKPIHVFGSLDPVTTPLYYLSGADIFDGLAWLRFIFHEGNAFYIPSFSPQMEKGVYKPERLTWGETISDNFYYLVQLRLDLKKFHSTGDFKIFKSHSKLFRDTYTNLDTKIRGDSDGRR